MEPCSCARSSDVSICSFDTGVLDCVDELSGEASPSLRCSLGPSSLMLPRSLCFGRADAFFLRTELSSSVCCSKVSISSFSATLSRLHRGGDFAVNDAPLLNFCCLTGSGTLTAELRLRLAALRATSAPTVAMVLISNDNSIMRID